MLLIIIPIISVFSLVTAIYPDPRIRLGVLYTFTELVDAFRRR